MDLGVEALVLVRLVVASGVWALLFLRVLLLRVLLLRVLLLLRGPLLLRALLLRLRLLVVWLEAWVVV